jgi:quercetin dioxygenase-like cupin family protein
MITTPKHPFACAACLIGLVLSVSIIAALPQRAWADGYSGNIAVRVLLKTDTTSLGQAIAYPDIENPEVTAIEVTIPPGGETGWHRHPVPGYGYILAGVLTLETEEGKTFVLTPGSAFAEVVHSRHNGRNLGSEPVKLVAFFTGEKGKAFTTKD